MSVHDSEPLIIERSQPGRRGYRFPKADVPTPELNTVLPGVELRAAPPRLPEVDELTVIRHFTRLSQRNFSIDTNFYPLGSCSMKYNPKMNEEAAGMPGFKNLHPYTPSSMAQGMLALLHTLERSLCGITGMEAFTLQPAAGAHGELVGMMLMRAYHHARGDAARHHILIPDSGHGTNPASAALYGFDVIELPSQRNGCIDLEHLRSVLGPTVAGVMLTNPNTLGLFEEQILEVSQLVHEAGALMYCDGANLNALMGVARPGDMGMDILHVNLHKTFSTPHGGGGPGAGPVGVSEALVPYLPAPRVRREGEQYVLDERLPKAIGRVRSFYGSILVLVRAYSYIRALGADGLQRVSEHAILNANYVKSQLDVAYDLAYQSTCMHECIFTATRQKAQGADALDIAKQLLDLGFHAPTVYFPLIVPEAIMIEPTETESKETLDAFIQAMLDIADMIQHDPQQLKHAPEHLPVGRLDEVTAARQPAIRWDTTPAASATPAGTTI